MTRYSRRTFVATATAAAVYSAARPLGSLAQSDSAQPLLFPEDFLWGAATSAMQVENSATSEGGGKSFWEPFIAKNPKLMKDASTPALTCDETHHWQDDIALMKEMGLKAYRFSFSWPRILPEGRGRINEKGLAFYDKFIDALLAAEIRPIPTVFHFDYPEPLEEKGGWLAQDSPKWLGDYAHLLSLHYSDRVTDWLTINEPNVLWSLGAEAGAFPPGKQLSDADLATGLHHILLGHGLSVQGIRSGSKRPLNVSLPISGFIQVPATTSQADIEAAKQSTFSPHKMVIIPSLPPLGLLNNGVWLDPIFMGRYSNATLAYLPHLNDVIGSSDMRIISAAVDRCSVNFYFAQRVKAGADGKAEIVPDKADTEHTHYGWPVVPEVQYWGPKFMHERYGKPILITENGMSWADKPSDDGRVHDPQRITFLNGYLNALRLAMHEGVPVDGYMHWSLLDNWEFTSGFTEQFGLVYVDHATQKRILKDSGLYYREIIQSRGAALM